MGVVGRISVVKVVVVVGKIWKEGGGGEEMVGEGEMWGWDEGEVIDVKVLGGREGVVEEGMDMEMKG